MPSNRLLARLSRADLRRIAPHLDAVDLPLRMVLQARNKRVDQVYFIDTGMASVVANGSQTMEVGVIGHEGMSGVSVLLDNDTRAVHETYMQIAGSGRRVSANALRGVVADSVTLQKVLLCYVHVWLEQTTQTALSNGRSKIEERLARWLLMARDRIDSDEVPLTHEFLSVMLGVRRSGVTVALRELERRGLIAQRRSCITIVDREGLEKNCNGTYRPVE